MAYIRTRSFKTYIYHLLMRRFIGEGNHSITPRRTVVSEKLIVPHSIAEFPAFSQTQKFINIVTKNLYVGPYSKIIEANIVLI
jgi:hypothetical protein